MEGTSVTAAVISRINYNYSVYVNLTRQIIAHKKFSAQSYDCIHPL